MSDTRKPNHHKFIFDVRFEEKEVAKLSGLKWDATIKKWYQWVESQSEIMKNVLNKTKLRQKGLTLLRWINSLN